MRDKNLDIYRGAIMIYITCFIHLMYWEGLSVGIYTSTCISGILIEMPVVFYIAGASFSLSSTKRYAEYVWSRIKRVAVPYWEYALFCFPIVLAFFFKKGYLIPWDDFLLYLFFTPPPVPRIFSHIWFILPYLLICFCFPFLFKCIKKYHFPFILFYGLFVLLMFCATDAPELIKMVIVYMLFAVWGMYYKQDIKRQNLVCMLASALYMGYALFLGGYSFNMQLNKFPPNLLFVSYCMLVLGIGGHLMQKVVVILYKRFAGVRKYIDAYGKDGYAIYLVHPFSTAIIYGIKYCFNLNGYIADSLFLKIIYVPIGFFFLLFVNLYVLKVYNSLLLFFYKIVGKILLRKATGS